MAQSLKAGKKTEFTYILGFKFKDIFFNNKPINAFSEILEATATANS